VYKLQFEWSDFWTPLRKEFLEFAGATDMYTAKFLDLLDKSVQLNEGALEREPASIGTGLAEYMEEMEDAVKVGSWGSKLRPKSMEELEEVFFELADKVTAKVVNAGAAVDYNSDDLAMVEKVISILSKCQHQQTGQLTRKLHAWHLEARSQNLKVRTATVATRFLEHVSYKGLAQVHDVAQSVFAQATGEAFDLSAFIQLPQIIKESLPLFTAEAMIVDPDAPQFQKWVDLLHQYRRSIATFCSPAEMDLISLLRTWVRDLIAVRNAKNALETWSATAEASSSTESRNMPFHLAQAFLHALCALSASVRPKLPKDTQPSGERGNAVDEDLARRIDEFLPSLDNLVTEAVMAAAEEHEFRLKAAVHLLTQVAGGSVHGNSWYQHVGDADIVEHFQVQMGSIDCDSIDKNVDKAIQALDVVSKFQADCKVVAHRQQPPVADIDTKSANMSLLRARATQLEYSICKHLCAKKANGQPKPVKPDKLLQSLAEFESDTATFAGDHLCALLATKLTGLKVKVNRTE